MRLPSLLSEILSLKIHKAYCFTSLKFCFNSHLLGEAISDHLIKYCSSPYSIFYCLVWVFLYVAFMIFCYGLDVSCRPKVSCVRNMACSVTEGGGSLRDGTQCKDLGHREYILRRSLSVSKYNHFS